MLMHHLIRAEMSMIDRTRPTTPTPPTAASPSESGRAVESKKASRRAPTNEAGPSRRPPREHKLTVDKLAERNQAIHSEYRKLEPRTLRRFPPKEDAPLPKGQKKLRRAPMGPVAYDLIPDPKGFPSQSHGYSYVGDIGKPGLRYTGISGDHTRGKVVLDAEFIEKVETLGIEDTATGELKHSFSDGVLDALKSMQGETFPSKELFAMAYEPARRLAEPNISDRQLAGELKALSIASPERWMQHWPRRSNLGHPAGRGWVVLDTDFVKLLHEAKDNTGQQLLAPECLLSIDALKGSRFRSREQFAKAYDAQRRQVEPELSDEELGAERHAILGPPPRDNPNLAERDLSTMEGFKGEDFATGKLFREGPVEERLSEAEVNSGSIVQTEVASFRVTPGADPLRAIEKNNEYWNLQMVTDAALKRDGSMKPAHLDEAVSLFGDTEERRLNMVENHPTYQMYPAGVENCNTGTKLSLQDAGVPPEDLRAASPWSFGWNSSMAFHDPLRKNPASDDWRDTGTPRHEDIETPDIRGAVFQEAPLDKTLEMRRQRMSAPARPTLFEHAPARTEAINEMLESNIHPEQAALAGLQFLGVPDREVNTETREREEIEMRNELAKGAAAQDPPMDVAPPESGAERG
jgi:hypothetical protein